MVALNSVVHALEYRPFRQTKRCAFLARLEVSLIVRRWDVEIFQVHAAESFGYGQCHPPP